MRKIKIYTTAGMPGTIETNVTTLGELKPILSQREINYFGMKMLVGETKNELSLDDAALPEGDFKLYLMPAKTKSGVDLDEMEENIEVLGVRTARIESKIDKILSILEKNSSVASSIPAPQAILSREDQEAMAELNKLASGSSIDEWND